MAKQGEHGIAWTDETWNPLRGCSRVSAGCRHCYAEAVAARFSGPGQPYEGLAVMKSDGPHWTGKVVLVEDKLAEPLRWRKPRRVFVNSMSDLFHESVPDEWIDRIFAVMALCPQHTFQVLTKRAKRMREYLAEPGRKSEILEEMATESLALCPQHTFQVLTKRAKRMREYLAEPGRKSEILEEMATESFDEWTTKGRSGKLPKQAVWDKNEGEVRIHDFPWPLPNVWPGVSVENQATADERIAELQQTLAAVRWVSYEPALAAVDFTSLGQDGTPTAGLNALTGEQPCCHEHPDRTIWHNHLDWIVIGGESGPGARPFDVAWARQTIAQCMAAGVACFVKQLGSHPHDGLRCLAQWMDGCGAQRWSRRDALRDRKGGDIAEWPSDLRVREWPKGAGDETE